MDKDKTLQNMLKGNYNGFKPNKVLEELQGIRDRISEKPKVEPPKIEPKKVK